MGFSRKHLQDANPELHAALERSWEIALNEWLPALGVQSDSFNSYPHLRNLEIHFDRLLSEIDAMSPGKGASLLSPIETYIVLISILLHDIGRIHAKDDHGSVSKTIIHENYSALGIPSQELCNTIADICEFHDFPAQKAEEKFFSLSTVVVDPYGEIRERECAALLMLIDHLDSAFTRVLPEYIKSLSRIEPIGAFRKVVRGVEVDLWGQMVKVVLGKDIWTKDIKTGYYELVKNTKRIPLDKGLLSPDLLAFHNVPEDLPKPALVRKLFKESTGFQKKEWVVARQLYFVENPKDGLPNEIPLDQNIELLFTPPSEDTKGAKISKNVHVFPWSNEMLLAVLMGNTRENAESIHAIRNVLKSLGLPIQQWLLEYEEHLYNEFGKETCEPIFYKDFLLEVARNMWKLSTEIFGQAEFSYETLAGQMSEPDIEKIRRAVCRIGILTRNDKPDDRTESRRLEEDALWVGQQRWMWNIRYSPEGKERRIFASIDEIENRINNISDPHGE